MRDILSRPDDNVLRVADDPILPPLRARGSALLFLKHFEDVRAPYYNRQLARYAPSSLSSSPSSPDCDYSVYDAYPFCVYVVYANPSLSLKSVNEIGNENGLASVCVCPCRLRRTLNETFGALDYEIDAVLDSESDVDEVKENGGVPVVSVFVSETVDGLCP